MSETAASRPGGAGGEADPQHRIAFQGAHGAYSDMACRMVFPDFETVPCPSFEDTFAVVREDRARYAMIPIDNSSAGRVADIHHLLPDSGLHIVGEHFQPVNHNLLGAPGATLDGIRKVHSHIQALSQCRQYLRARGLEPVEQAGPDAVCAIAAHVGETRLIDNAPLAGPSTL